MFTKLGRDEVLIAPHMDLCFGHIHPGADPGKGGPFLKKILFQAGRLQQPTECIAII